MSASRGRQPWEYADGATVQTAGGAGELTELREVRAEDPELSPTTNQRLTEELRAIVGTDRVRVPASRPHAAHGQHPHQHGVAARFKVSGLQLLRTTAIALTFGGIIALITRDWWVLPLAAGVNGLGTMAVTLTIIRLTTTSEHPSPEVAAAMAEEGVRNPDERFSRMVDEFRAEPERGVAEVISPGFNDRTVPADVDPAAAAAEQSSAMTPTGPPSHPSAERGAPDAMVWVTMIWLFVASIIVPPLTGGGWMWLLTAVMVPLLVGWGVLQRLMVKRRNQLHEVVHGRTPLVAIVVCTAVAVAAFCAVVAFAFQH